jgi:glyoxylase-like metal-dependent hydrolase (beta-lactamase superfamily II)
MLASVAPMMLGEELRPGLRTWTAHHEEWEREVRCVALVSPERLVLVDPLLVGEEQWSAFDETLGDRGLDVLLTVYWHARSAAEIAARHPRARVWAHSRARAAVARRAQPTDVFRVGDELPGGLVAIAGRPRTEVVLWDPAHRALIAGDVLLGAGEGGEELHTCPASWLPRSTGVAELRESLRPALDLPVELVLVSHGATVETGAKAALERALAP